MEREVDRHKHGANQLIQRNEQLVKDLENHRHQLHHNSMQMENMKRELGDALVSLTNVYYIDNCTLHFIIIPDKQCLESHYLLF